eukprot:COSAG02_NODE_3653_length_6413_cov_4.685144_7_plen_63_part_00
MFVVNRLDYEDLRISPGHRSLLGGADDPMTPELRKEMEQSSDQRPGRPLAGVVVCSCNPTYG